MRKARTELLHRGGFTLIELLVVIGIVTLLMGILLPAINRARDAAKQAQCGANLRSVGQAIGAYLNDNNAFYPPMASLPTKESLLHPTNPRPPMCDVLAPYVSNQKDVFRCPSDRIYEPGETPPAGVTTWFEWQGSSYEPRMGLSLVDANGYWLLSKEGHDRQQLESLLGSTSKIMLGNDYEGFHGRSGSGGDGVTMTLFADFHVEALAGS